MLSVLLDLEIFERRDHMEGSFYFSQCLAQDWRQSIYFIYVVIDLSPRVLPFSSQLHPVSAEGSLTSDHQ